MKRRISLAIAGVISLLLAACSGGSVGGTETGNSIPNGVGYAVGDSVDTVTGLLSVDLEIGPNVALARPRPTLFARIGRFILGSACAGPLCVETAICDDLNHTATFVKNYSAGCDVGDGFTVEGKRYISWFNMGPDSCKAPDAPPIFVNAVQGLGARQVRSTDVIPDSGECGTVTTSLDYAFDDGSRLEITQCGTLDFLDFQSPAPGESTVTEKLSLGTAHRVLFGPKGAKVYDHTLFTSTPLIVDLIKLPGRNRPNKIIHEGKVGVTHSLAHFTVETDYQEVEWNYEECRCYPVSGTIAFSVTDDLTGQGMGDGSIVFNKDATGACRLVQATFQGQSLTVPLHNCRGN